MLWHNISPRGTVRARRLVCLALLGITLPAGLVWRLAPLHLSQFAFKYGGSALWAMAVYWVLGIAAPRREPQSLAAAAALVAASVELAKLIFWPPLDRFRETLPGRLLLGRYFTLGAILAYWLAIALVAVLDWRYRPGRVRGAGDTSAHRADNTLA